jgi:hypothetical protein
MIPLLALGAVALGALALTGGSSTSSTSSTPAPAPSTTPSGLWPALELREKALATTAKFESAGRYDSINPNRDGAGLSYGLINWAQKPGSLGELLAYLDSHDHARFVDLFGGGSGEQAALLLAATKGGGVNTINGVNLWSDPWLSRFKAAGADPVFKAAQHELAVNGKYMRGAIDACNRIHVYTDRALALAFDRCVQQGEGAVGKVARSLQASTLDDSSESERLRKFRDAVVAAAPSSFRSDCARRADAILKDTSFTAPPLS